MSKQKLKRTIRGVGYAPIIAAEDGTGSYGKPVWLPSLEAGGREYSAEPQGEMQDIWADGVCVYYAEDSSGYAIKLILLAVTDNVEKDWLGNSIDENGGVLEYADGVEKPKFALFIIEDSTDNKGLTTIYYNCQVSARPTDSGKTSEGGKFESQFPEYSIVARPREIDKLVRYKINQKERFSEIPEPSTIENA